MFSKITRAAVSSTVVLAMLAGCAPNVPLSSDSQVKKQWIITPSQSKTGDSVNTDQVIESNLAKAFENAKSAESPRQEATKESVHKPTSAVQRALEDKDDIARTGNSQDFSDLMASKAQSLVTGKVQSLLEQFGTVELSVGQVGGDQGFSGSLDMLLPVVDRDDDLLFTQLGIRRSNQYTDSNRTTVNAGIGYRKFFKSKYDYMLGANLFYDQDITVGHQRVGLGGEYWMDNLKLAANAYIPLSNWKHSPDLDYYLERPAKGFDLRAEGYLPMYPQLGGKLMYEQYFGDEVGLFGVKNRSSNPNALTVGLSYTPVPAISLEVDHKMGQSGLSSTNATVNFKYQLGVPWSKQFSTKEVAATRKLEAMRYDLVQRNNEIVLEYKKVNQEVHLPGEINGYPDSIQNFKVAFTGLPANTKIKWTGSAASFASDYVPGSATGEIKFPAYNQTGANTYELIAQASYDDEIINSNPMLVTVDPVAITMSSSKPVAMADGTDNVAFTTSLVGVKGEPMVNHAVSWQIPDDVNVVSTEDTTDNEGKAVAVINSTLAFLATVSATDVFGFTDDGETEFLADKTTARVDSLIADPANILANNKDTSTVTATVTDAFGNPVGDGVGVTFGGDVTGSGTTDANSQTSFVIPAKTAPMIINVTAKANTGDTGKSTSIEVALDLDNAKVVNLVADPANILANDIDTSTITATVEDAFGNPVGAGVEVKFSGDEIGSAITDANSKAIFVAPAKTVPMTSTITAKASINDAGKSVDVTYDIDLSAAQVASLVADPANILANDKDTSTVTATVTDDFGNLVGSGIEVAFSGDLTGSGTTDANSQVSITAPSSTTPKTITVKAAVTSTSDTGKSVDINYAIDLSGARVDSFVASPSKIPANDLDTSTLTATVTDAFGNLVGSGVDVGFSGDLTGSGSTDANSQVSITAPSSTTPKTITVKAAVTSTSDAGKSVSLEYELDFNNLFVIDLVASKTSLLANNKDTSTLTATVEDAFGQPVGAGVEVSFSDGATGSATTDADSKATFVVPAKTVPMTANIIAKASINDSGKSVSITYDIDLSGAKVNSIVASPASILANNSNTSKITATVTDAFGNLVGSGINVAFTGGLTGSGTTNASSQVSITAPKATTPKTITVKAAVTSTSDAGKSTSVTYKVDTSKAKVTALTASPTSLLANGSAKSTLTATVTDAYGNAVGSGVKVNFSGGASGSANTNASSKATFTVPARTSAATLTIKASVANTGDAGKSVKVTYNTAREVKYDNNHYILECFGACRGGNGYSYWVWGGTVIYNQNFKNGNDIPGHVDKGGYRYSYGDFVGEEYDCPNGSDWCDWYGDYTIVREPIP